MRWCSPRRKRLTMRSSVCSGTQLNPRKTDREICLRIVLPGAVGLGSGVLRRGRTGQSTAAQALGRAQSLVSEQVAKLETEPRHHAGLQELRPITLTVAGEVFLGRPKIVLATLDQCASRSGGVAGSLRTPRLACMSSVVGVYVPRLSNGSPAPTQLTCSVGREATASLSRGSPAAKSDFGDRCRCRMCAPRQRSVGAAVTEPLTSSCTLSTDSPTGHGAGGPNWKRKQSSPGKWRWEHEGLSRRSPALFERHRYEWMPRGEWPRRTHWCRWCARGWSKVCSASSR